ncbi:MAG: bifunctional folylpolyglutamate synthase/dihydrofolate synthase [Deltaproteobacteria bacterium]|nr:bifunctional folylpolyglutamate synthase/dihydrofolate synthase [Deltaproteobacteria bacterium]
MTTPGDYLSQLNSSIIRLGLGPVRKLLASLHNPQNRYASVLIGGTNGKGSIAATTAAIMQAAGYRVGLYTSPHLIDIRERIRVNGDMIAVNELDGLIDEVRGQVGEEITYFEFLTAVAFLYFYRRQVEVAILEVGLGGRLDATNVVIPVLSVISNISLEHGDYLGKGLANIAREKGGIIPVGGVCVTAARQKPVREILAGICLDRQAQLYQLGRDISVRRHHDGTFSYRGIKKNYPRLACSLRGRHQVENTALALAAIELLADRGGLPVSDAAVYRGMQNTRWEGRLEVLQSDPQIIVDGGHNPAGIAVLGRALREDFSYRRLILIFGVLRDKNFQLMLKKIAPLADVVIITRPDTARAVPPGELTAAARLYCDHVEIVADTRQALYRAMAVAAREDLICVAGSLYLIGEIKQAYAATHA